MWYEHLTYRKIRSDQINPVGRGIYTRHDGGTGKRERAFFARRAHQPWIPGDDEWSRFLEIVLREEPLRNQAMAIIAYLLTRFTNFLIFEGHDFKIHQLAWTIFGRERLSALAQQLCEILEQRGYSFAQVRRKMHLAVALVSLVTFQPSFEHVTYELLRSLYGR